MKERSKFNEYRFLGKIVLDDIQPWYDFATNKPWDSPEVPWVIDNKVRRQILILLSHSSSNFEELYEKLNFTPKPLIISEDEYKPGVKYQWGKQTLENHLLNLEWYGLIKKTENKYESLVPILDYDDNTKLDEYILKFIDRWAIIIKEIKDEIDKNFNFNKNMDINILSILIEKSVDKLYKYLKQEKILPNIPNIKIFWAEQLRKIKMKDWLDKNF